MQCARRRSRSHAADARAVALLLVRPSVVLLDEVSMGLAPRIIDEIFEMLLKLSDDGVSLLLVEQYVSRALRVADRVHLLGRGMVTFSVARSELDEAELMRRYMGGQSCRQRRTALSAGLSASLRDPAPSGGRTPAKTRG